MEPIDKFGNEIYHSVYSELKNCAVVLINKGFNECRNKPNLFYKNIREGILWADMRGTKEIKIWEVPFPVLYWKFEPNIPVWLRRRTIQKEKKDLEEGGCSVRFTFYEEYEPEGLMSGSCNEDGFCKICGKDFQNEGLYCSEECKKEGELRAEKEWISYLKKCEACGEPIEFEDLLEHHLSYSPEKKVWVHKSCHNKIHKTNEYPKLKPIDKRPKF